MAGLTSRAWATAAATLLLTMAVISFTMLNSSGSRPAGTAGDFDEEPIRAYEANTTLRSIQRLIEDNLNADMGAWESSFGIKTVEVQEFFDAHLEYSEDPNYRLMLSYNGKLYILSHQNASLTKPAHPCADYLETLMDAVRRHSDVVLPNALFIYNAGDYSACQEWRCDVPVLSLIKDLSQPRQTDLLVPTFQREGRLPLLRFPWAKKAPKAMFSGTAYCPGGHRLAYPPEWGSAKRGLVTCPRVHFASKVQHGDWGPLMEVRLTSGFGSHPDELKTFPELPGPIDPKPGVGWHELCRYRYQLALDGYSASNRLSKLMMCNSPVLKQWSTFAEYFYRSLEAGKHYIEFWSRDAEDVKGVIEAHQGEGKVAALQAIAANAQHFSATLLNERARMLYLQAVLERYRSLFADMDQHIEAAVWPYVRQRLEQLKEER